MNLVVGALYVRRRVYSPEYEKLLYWTDFWVPTV